MTDTETTCDVLIVGAGPAGSAAATVLASAGVQVVVIERRSHVDFRFGEMLPPHAQPLLQRIGVQLSDLVEQHAPAHGTVSSWGGPEPYCHDLIFHPHGSGVRLDRPRFDAQLRDRAIDAGADVHRGQRVVAAEQLPNGGPQFRVSAETDAGLVDYDADAVIDCSGRRSVSARLMGATRHQPEDLMAYAQRYQPPPSGSTDAFLRIEAIPSGWLYTLQIPSGERMLVLHTDADVPLASTVTTTRSLRAALEESVHIAALLEAEGANPSGRLRVTSAGSAWMEPCVAPGWLAAGDATISFDPLASQGIVNALTTGLAAADAILAGTGLSSTGPSEAAERYRESVATTAAEYQQQWSHYYASEQRWPDQPFWQRRHALASASA